MEKISKAPDGTEYKLPDAAMDAREIEELDRITAEQREIGRQIVAVQGLGFVGCVMAAVIADAVGPGGRPFYFVHGVQRPSTRSYWKVPRLNEGVTPVDAEDPEIQTIFPRTVEKKRTLRGTWHEHAYEIADIVVVDIQLDATKPEFGNAAKGYCDLEAFRAAMSDLGRLIQPDCLVLVETTVPPGTCRHVVKPILEKEFRKRDIDPAVHPPRICHSYERVMPGRQYVSSIRDFWRAYAGIDDESEEMGRRFLTHILSVDEFPLSGLGDTNASELAKTMENSYRAINIALLQEWALYAEDIGINLFEVIQAIRARKGTHDNLLEPSLGVGGYCLTKDPVLAHWASTALFDRDRGLEMAIQAVDINDKMPLHTVDLTRDALGGSLEGKTVVLLGVSYLKDVGDTRHSPSQTFWKALAEEGARPVAHDPLVQHWEEMPSVRVRKDLWGCLSGADAVVFAVGHQEYRELDSKHVVDATGKIPAIIDTRNMLTDHEIEEYLKLGCEVRGIGKGHIRLMKERIAAQ